MGRLASALVFLAVCAMAPAMETRGSKNPVRKVVQLLQSMQKKVEAEGKKETELYEKFVCYCKSSVGALQKDIEEAGEKIPELESAIKAASELKGKVEGDLKGAEADRKTAKASMATGTALREKEAAAFAGEKAEYEANIKSITKAVTALEAGGGASFLQSSTAKALVKIVNSRLLNGLVDADRQDVLTFLSGTEDSSDEAPGTSEIVGILKTMSDEMTAGLNEATNNENKAITEYEDMMAATKKEVAALNKSIETKLKKIGELGVKIAQMKADLGDTQESLAENQKFFADLDKTCAKAAEDYEVNQKLRTQELKALADTIKILNDDDALELFKKTLPGAGASSFLQVVESASSMRKRALAHIHNARHRAHPHDRAHVDFIALAMHGKKIGFDKVIGMIDKLIAELKKDQATDDAKKEYCNKEFDLADDKKKSLEGKIGDINTAMATCKEDIKSTTEEIAALNAGIKALDKEVMAATLQRQAENAEYKQLMAENGAAKELLKFAMNRLDKFYNPKLYKAPDKKELSKGDRIAENHGVSFVQISDHSLRSNSQLFSFVQTRASNNEENEDSEDGAPPPPPETAGAYSKKSEDSMGVIEMIKLLIKDLDKELTEAEVSEKNAQEEYEGTMKDSAEKRSEDSKTLGDKEGTLAQIEGELEKLKVAGKSAAAELDSTKQYIISLHAECDFLLQYYGVRKEARTGEIDSLSKAKDVLQGADYSFLQMRTRHRRLKR